MRDNFLDRVIDAFGGVTPTSTYRSKEEQDELFRRGKTRLKGGESAHNIPDHAADLPTSVAPNSKTAQEILRQAGVTDAEVIYESGQGRNQGTGPHYHVEQTNGRTQVATQPKQDITMEDVLATVASATDADKSLYSELMPGGGDAAVMNPFDVEGNVREVYEETLQDANAAKSVLDQAIPEIDKIQEQRLAALKETVTAKQEINEELRANTEAVIQKTRPLFGQRTAIAERQAELARMNPLKRGFMSLFDASYDRKHLAELDTAAVGQLNAIGSDYENSVRLQSALVNFVEQQYAGQDSIQQLVLANTSQDIELAGQSFAGTSRVLGTIMQGLETQTNLWRAQAEMKQKVLGTMTAGQVGAAINRMGDNNEIELNGAMISKAELVDLQKRYQMQEWRFEEAKLSRETAAINKSAAALRLAEERENLLLGSLTTPQLQEVAKNGGQYRGMQLDMRLVGDALRRSIDTDQLVYGGMLQDQAPKLAKQGVDSVRAGLRFATIRAKEIFGAAPKELIDLQSKIAREAQAIAQLQQQANQAGKGSMAAEQMLKQIAGWQDSMNKTVDSMVTKWAGGRKELEPLGRAFLTGSELAGPAAIEGLISLARTGLPPGSKLGGAAGAAYQATQRILKGESATKPGISIEEALKGGDKKTAEQARQELHSRVAQVVQGTYNGQLFNEALLAAPEIAKSIGHVAGQLDPRILMQAMTAGDEEGYQRIADSLKISPDQAKSLFDEGESSPVWAQVKQSNPSASFDQLAGQLKTVQQSAMLNALDSSAPKINGHKPSAVFTSLLNDQRFQARVQAGGAAQRQSGFTDFVVGSVAGNSLGGQIAQYGFDAQQIQNQLEIAQTRTRLGRAQQYRGNSVKRMQVTLGAIPGISPTEERALLKAVRALVPDTTEDIGNAFSATQAIGEMTRNNENHFNSMRQIIMSQSFEDPGLERVRRVAAKHLDAALDAADNAVDRFLEAEED